MNLQELIAEETNQEMYRQLSMKFHPDRGGDPEIMKDINQAYNIENWFKIEKLFNKYIKQSKQKGKLAPHTNEFFKMVRKVEQECRDRDEGITKIIPDEQSGTFNVWIYWRFDENLKGSKYFKDIKSESDLEEKIDNLLSKLIYMYYK
jgi:DnaJ-class molecular chaperone